MAKKSEISTSEKWFVDAALKAQKPEPKQEVPQTKPQEEKLHLDDPKIKEFIKDWQMKNFGRLI